MMCSDEVYAACARLTAAFAILVDAHRNDELGELFTQDCSFERPGVSLGSRAELVTFMSARPRDQLTRHCCTPPLIEQTGEDEAKGVTYLTFYQGEVREEGPGKLLGVTAFAEYHDLFRKTADGWRIAARRVVPIMMAG
ncbi:nuclear transport factor 2 family protein [Sphingobium aquiterrae]|uniref:nuclear transport factor 2 family protein n=1 Tax=Sphingobium aquiterrae TaxID=2038656 RepID=UPI0030176A52